MVHNADSFVVEHAICQFLRTVKAASFLLEQWVAHSRAGEMTLDEIAGEAEETLNTLRAAKRNLRETLRTVRQDELINHAHRLTSLG